MPQEHLIATQLNRVRIGRPFVAGRGARGGAEWRWVDFELGGGVRVAGGILSVMAWLQQL